MINITILTGAGVSAESGIPTFRATDGLWQNHRIDEVATPEGYARNPALVQQFYNQRRRDLLAAAIAPNAAHYALARLQSEHKGTVTLVTQNIDDLHERADSRNVIHMHGELLKMRCTRCASVFETRDDIAIDQQCANCPSQGSLRPHIVWFGEIPFMMEEIERALLESALFIAVGTSGQVYPAAGFVDLARSARAHTIEVNPEPTASTFAERRVGTATTQLPALVDELLSASWVATGIRVGATP